MSYTDKEIQEGYANALMLRNIANQQVEFWERLIKTAPSSAVKKEARQALKVNQIKAKLLAGRRKTVNSQ